MKRFTTLLFGVLLSALAMAEEDCSIDLQYDFEVSSHALEVSRESKTLYQVLQGGQLNVRGEAVELDGEQAELAQEYAGEVAALILQWVELIPRALELAEVTVAGAFTAAFGEDSAPVTTSARVLALARETFERSVTVEDGAYSISMTEFNSLEETMGEELTEEMEDALMSSLGSLIIEFGQAVVSSEGSFEERMTAFGARIDVMDKELGRLDEELEDISRDLCAGKRKVRKLEQRVEKEIPELAEYMLFAR